MTAGVLLEALFFGEGFGNEDAAEWNDALVLAVEPVGANLNGRSGHDPRTWSILWPMGSLETTSCRWSGDVHLISALALILVTAPHLDAQWVKPPTPGAPRTADGKVDLNGPAPRTADGKPDLSGMWLSSVKFNTNLAADFKGEVPMTAWGKALYDERRANNSRDDPDTYCLPAGVPRLTAAGALPSRIVQLPAMVVILYERNFFRQIYMDGRTLQKDLNPTWMGYSTGAWEGDALVVRSTGFNDKTWLDDLGHPHSESLNVIERYRRPDYGHLLLDITLEDEKVYTRPWTVTQELRLDPTGDLIEYVCNENERDAKHIVGR